MAITEKVRPGCIDPSVERREGSPISLPIVCELGVNPISNQALQEYAKTHNVTTASGELLTAEKIERATGIAMRHEAAPYQTEEYMAQDAALQLARLSGTPDAIIVSSSHPQEENLAFLAWKALHEQGIANRLPQKGNIPHSYFEVNAACSGLVVALAHMWQYQNYYTGKLTDVIAAERYRHTLPPLEKDCGKDGSLQGTIFSDGYGGMSGVYGRDFTVVGPPVIKLFQDETRALCFPQPHPANPPSFTLDIPVSADGFQTMKGNEVYRWTVKELPKTIEETIEGTDAKKIILHQANGRIIEAIKQKFGEEYDFPNNIERIGNTSSASILFALRDEMKAGRIKKGDHVAFVGFGAGLAIAGVVVQFG